MAEPDMACAPRVVRIPVRRPLTAAVTVVAVGAALLAGGGTQGAPKVSASSKVSGQAAQDSTSGVGDWDVSPRDLVVGERTKSMLAVDEVLSDPLQVSTLAAALEPGAGVRQSGTLVTATDIPEVLWAAYRSARASAPAACRLPVQLLAAIGQVESGSLAGRSLDSRHRAAPAVLGPVLDGRGFAAIRDTDGGRFDGDPVWDRAVGPMQFIPSTWQRWGRDGNHDGVRDPQNVEDAAYSAAAYLCAGGRDLAKAAGLRSAILSYNHSAAYLADVLRLMKTVTPGGPAPRSVATVAVVLRPVVGPPSAPPVRAVASPQGSSGSGTTVPRTPGSTTRSSGTSGTTRASPTSSTTTTNPQPTTVTATTTTTATGGTSPPITTTTTTTTMAATPPPVTTSTVTTTTPPTTPPTTTTATSTSLPTTSTSTTTTTTTCPVTPSTGGTTATAEPSATTEPSTTTDPGATSPTTTADPDPCASPSSTTTASAGAASADPVLATTTSIDGPTTG